MIRKLAIISGSAFVLSVACLAGAAALASHDIAKNGGTWSFSEAGDGNFSFPRRTTAKVEPSVTRTLAWSGGERLDIDLPAEVVYSQGAAPSVTVNGPRTLTDRVRLENGRLYLADGPNVEKVVHFRFAGGHVEGHASDELKVVITAPSVRDFAIGGAGDLRVSGYDQPSIDLTITGSGSADISGQARALKLDISGAGEADLSALRVEDADISISGSGEASVAPTGKAKVVVSGSGNVDLKSRPTSLDTQISGAGSVEQD